MTDIKTQRIALDADGVILNFDVAWRRTGSALLGRELFSQAMVYDFSRRYGLSAEEEARVWDVFHQQEGIRRTPALPGAIDAVAALCAAGYDVHIVTAISPEHQAQRMDCLQRLGLPDIPVHCVGAGGRKEDLLRWLSPGAYVDDRIKHLHEAERAGIPVRIWLDDGISQCTPAKPGLITKRVYALADALPLLMAPLPAPAVPDSYCA